MTRNQCLALLLGAVSLACAPERTSDPATGAHGKGVPTTATQPSVSTSLALTQPAAPSPTSTTRTSAEWERAPAQAYLDTHAQRWLDSRFQVGNMRCALSCHTTFAYTLVGSPLSTSVLPSILDRVEQRVALPGAWADQSAYYGKRGSAAWRRSLATEAVLNAASLAISDARASHGARPITRQAIERMWEVQREDGAWSWIDFGLEPWEAGNDDWGAAIAALAVGSAGVETDAPRVERLRAFLRKRYQSGDMRLFDELALAWASLHLEGLLSADERLAITEDLRARQRDDGAWSTVTLIGREEEGAGDGIATGLAVFVLCSVRSEPVAVRAGVRWLVEHQEGDGSWPARSISTGRSRSNRFMKNAATAFAVLALEACGGRA